MAMAAGGSGGGAARPFAGACVHPRVSTPPSKGYAVVPLTPEPEAQPCGGMTCPVGASGSSHAPAMEMTGGEDGTAGPQVGSPFSTVPFLFLGLGFLFPIRFVRFGSSLSFDFFSFLFVPNRSLPLPHRELGLGFRLIRYSFSLGFDSRSAR